MDTVWRQPPPSAGCLHMMRGWVCVCCSRRGGAVPAPPWPCLRWPFSSGATSGARPWPSTGRTSTLGGFRSHVRPWVSRPKGRGQQEDTGVPHGSRRPPPEWSPPRSSLRAAGRRCGGSQPVLAGPLSVFCCYSVIYVAQSAASGRRDPAGRGHSHCFQPLAPCSL